MHSLRDAGTDPADAEQNFGLLRADFTHKPTFDVVRGVVAESSILRNRAVTAGANVRAHDRLDPLLVLVLQCVDDLEMVGRAS